VVEHRPHGRVHQSHRERAGRRDGRRTVARRSEGMSRLMCPLKSGGRPRPAAAAATIRAMLAGTPVVAASPSMARAGTIAVRRASRARPPTARSTEPSRDKSVICPRPMAAWTTPNAASGTPTLPSWSW
jgi:hypothetical protein